MATSGDLMMAVAGFLHRKPSDFVVGGWDNLLQAANNARKQAERLVDFELARVSATIASVSLTNGGDLSTAVLYGTATPVSVRKIKRAFLQFTDLTGTFPISIMSRDRWLDRQQRRYERALPTDHVDALRLTGAPLTLVQQGEIVQVVPADSAALGGETFPLYLDVYKWLPEYGTTAITGSATSTTANKLVASAATFITSAVKIGAVVRNTTTGASALVTAVDSQTQLTLNADIFVSGNAFSILRANETDFLLTNCFDWLMYAAIQELNAFLKEDERVALAEKVTQRAWEGMVRWNGNYISAETENTALD